MRLIRWTAVLFAGTALWGAPPQKLTTAVFTLDAKQRTFVDKPDNPLESQLAGWAAQCKIEPADPIAVLNCPKAPAESEEDRDAGEKIPATMGLFRDLNETIYVAGCPIVAGDSGEGSSPPRDDKAAKPKPDDIRDCRDVEAGQTFPSVVEDGLLRVLVRGRQLALRIFETREKPQTSDTPYIPQPSEGGLPPAPGPQTTRQPKGLEPQVEPKWDPTELSSPSSGTPSQTNSPGGEPAHTSLRTGRVTVQCPSRQIAILIDGAYMGTCPMTTPLVAGPHTVTIRRPGQAEQVVSIRVEAGKTLKIDSEQAH